MGRVMPTRPLTPEQLRAAWGEWNGRAARGPWFGVCGDCRESKLVARRERCRAFVCFECFAGSPYARRAARRVAA